jgi:hypothetical protein
VDRLRHRVRQRWPRFEINNIGPLSFSCPPGPWQRCLLVIDYRDAWGSGTQASIFCFWGFALLGLPASISWHGMVRLISSHYLPRIAVLRYVFFKVSHVLSTNQPCTVHRCIHVFRLRTQYRGHANPPVHILPSSFIVLSCWVFVLRLPLDNPCMPFELPTEPPPYAHRATAGLVAISPISFHPQSSDLAICSVERGGKVALL